MTESAVMSTVAERVAAGAAFLDEHDPGWWRADVERAIDLEHLDLHSLDSCVLGQRCPVTVLADALGVEHGEDVLSSSDWVHAYRAYGEHLSGITGHLKLAAWAQDLGFNAHGGEEEFEEFAGLTAEWKRVIAGRRAAA